MIADEQLHVDLTSHALADPEHVKLFVAKPIATVATGKNDATLTESGAPLGAPDTEEMRQQKVKVLDVLSHTCPANLQHATERYRHIQPLLDGVEKEASGASGLEVFESKHTTVTAAPSVPQRTLRRWKSNYLKAQAELGEGFVGLIPDYKRCGQRVSRIADGVRDLMAEVISQDFETIKQKRYRVVYGALIDRCSAIGETAPSYKTFLQAIHARPKAEQIEKREGHRAAYRVKTFFWTLDQTTPRHGDRPFEICHIDHTELDIELVCSRTGRNLGRPWATFLMDAFSRRLLALVLSFDVPSYRACMLVLRECVKRHQRLPQALVVDGGREFESLYFEALLARYEVTKKTRPAAMPRFGSVCERLFGTTNTMFIHNLQGNTQITRKGRQMTKAVDPKRHACWTLGELDMHLRRWVFEVYETVDHPTLGVSPREAFDVALATSGVRPHRNIDYDESFIMATLPTTHTGKARVRAYAGVQINRIRYWSDAFRDQTLDLQSLPVRFDPFDVGTAYVFVQGRWVRCISEHHAQFQNRSLREIALISEELRRRNKMIGQTFRATSARIARFIQSAETTEAVLQQRMRDLARQELLRDTASHAGSGAGGPASASILTHATSNALDHKHDQKNGQKNGQKNDQTGCVEQRIHDRSRGKRSREGTSATTALTLFGDY
jgi:transposase InsO family protein